MKRFVVASLALAAFAAPAFAADMPVKAPMAVAAPVYDWTGLYVGGTAGYGWGTDNHTAAAASSGSFNTNGGIYGVTAGYNWQFNRSWVVGIEADYSGSSIKGSLTNTTTFGCNCVTNVTSFGTARGRLGFAVDRVLFYGTGGWAVGRAHADDGALGATGANTTVTKSGWTAGAGVEYGFLPNWTAKVEYLHVDLGNFVYFPVPPPAVATAKFDAVRFGVNYKFGGL